VEAVRPAIRLVLVRRQRLRYVCLGIQGRGGLQIVGGAGEMVGLLGRGEGLLGVEAMEQRLVGDGGGDVVDGRGRHCRPAGEVGEQVGRVGGERKGGWGRVGGEGVRVREEAVELLGFHVAQQRGPAGVELAGRGAEEVCREGVCAGLERAAAGSSNEHIQPKGDGSFSSMVLPAPASPSGGRTPMVSSASGDGDAVAKARGGLQHGLARRQRQVAVLPGACRGMCPGGGRPRARTRTGTRTGW
jgi:hypothetical protein